MTTQTLRRVNRYTRAALPGKFIYCPKCGTQTMVFHFSWSAITCDNCGEMIDKTNWYLDDPDPNKASAKGSNKYAVTLTKRTWLEVLIHLKDTVDNIPVSTVEPDPWQAVSKTIKEIEKFVTLEEG